MSMKELRGVIDPIPFLTGFLCGVICTLFAILLFWAIYKPELRAYSNIYVLQSTDGTSPTVVIMPIDVVELTKAFFSGLAALFSAVAVGYAMYSAARAKRAEVATMIAHQALTNLTTNMSQLEKSIVEKVENANGSTVQKKANR